MTDVEWLALILTCSAAPFVFWPKRRLELFFGFGLCVLGLAILALEPPV